MILINKTLLALSKGFRGWIALMVVLKMVILVGITMFANSIGAILGRINDLSITNEELSANIIQAVIASVLMLVGELLVGEAEYYCTAKSRLTLRERIFGKVMELDVRDVDAIGASDAINAAVDGIETMQVYYNQYLPGIVYSFIAPIYLFFNLWNKSSFAALVLLVFSIVIMPVNALISRKIFVLKQEYWDGLSDLTSYYLESINGLVTTELFNRGDDREATLFGKAKHLGLVVINIMKVNFLGVGGNEFFINAGIFTSTLIVSIQAMKGELPLTSALIVLLLSYGFFSAFRKLHWISHSALMGIAAAQNVSRILDIDTRIKVDPDCPEDPEGFHGIKLDNVSFSYKGRDSVLTGVNMKIKKGETTAIVGESGSGKSTVANMLLRFYDAQEGNIYFRGKNNISYTPEELRKHIIMVPQFVYIFSGTLRENLLIANEQATEEEMRDALFQVKLLDWVDTLPQGLDTPLGDAGSILSGGQRQKIGIARALLSKAEYIVFDESTSSVDESSEQEIWRCINGLALTRTLIIISHRLSTIRNADNIYVLEKGKICEHGSHDELMAKHGLYSRLVEQQNILEMMGERSLAHG